MIEVHATKPEGFVASVEVAGCFIEIDNKILFLERTRKKVSGGTWGVPGGKLEHNETPEQAAKRELFEETGITAHSPLQYIYSLYMRLPHVDYIFHMFAAHFDQMPDVQLCDENDSYKWATAKDLEEMPLIPGGKEAIEYYHAKKL